MVLAIDFDGTLCRNEWPSIGAPNERLIELLKERKSKGDKLILWTCRTDEALVMAIKWCQEHGLFFDAVNQNVPEIIKEFGGDCRKVYADIYMDDRAVFGNQNFEDTIFDLENCLDVFWDMP